MQDEQSVGKTLMPFAKESLFRSICDHLLVVYKRKCNLTAHMPELHLRPRYRFILPLGTDAVMQRVRGQMRSNNPADLKLRGTLDHLVLRFPSHIASIWTPQMQLFLEPKGEGRTLVRAIIGPTNRIWQFFLGSLTAFVTVGAMGFLVGFAQWSNGSTPWGFYLAVLGMAASLFLFFLFEAAKQRTKDERDLLLMFMDNALDVDCTRMSRDHGKSALSS